LEETVSSKDDEEQERSREIASERWKVSEWKVRIAQEIGDMVKFPYRT